MSIPRYRTGERVRVIVEGPIVDVLASGVELTVALETPNASYEVTVPTSHVTIERLDPAGGEPQPGQLWADATGEERYAYRSSKNEAVSLLDDRGVGVPWRIIHTDPQLGPITRVRPLPDAAAPQPEADQLREPRLMLGDVWRDDQGERRLIVQGGVPGLTLSGGWVAWEEANRDWGPLTLVRRAGYLRTTDTAAAGQLRSGTVVSYPGWDGDVPARLLTVQALAAGGVEVTYEPLGGADGEVGTGTAAPDARITLWDKIAGGAR